MAKHLDLIKNIENVLCVQISPPSGFGLPRNEGVYLAVETNHFYNPDNSNDEIIYVGSSKNLQKRVYESKHKLDLYRDSIKDGRGICYYYIECENAVTIEKSIIQLIKPKLNIVWNKDIKRTRKKNG